MADRKTFEQDVATVRAEAADAKVRLLARLKRLRPEQFARVPREDLEQLTWAEYCDVLGLIAPGTTPARTAAANAASVRRRRWRDQLTLLSQWQRSLVIMVSASLAALVILGLGPAAIELAHPVPLTRSRQPLDWPLCPRLTAVADGCVYRPRQNLDWDYVAASIITTPRRRGLKSVAIRIVSARMDGPSIPRIRPSAASKSCAARGSLMG